MEAMILSDVGLWLGGTPLAGASNQVALDLGADELDATTWDDGEHNFLIAGKAVQIEASGFYDPEVDAGIDEAMAVADGQLVTVAPLGAEHGAPAFSFIAAVASLSRAGSWGEPATFELSGAAAKDSALVRGQIAQVMKGAAAGTYHSPGLQLGSLPANRRLFVGVHVTKASGTTPSVILRVQSGSSSTFSTAADRLALPVRTGPSWSASTVPGPISHGWWCVVTEISGASAAFDFVVVLGFADEALQGSSA